ncbi:unnamed protein product [Ectocarpus sp. CCAP 1310/34]|nr:unnamed protein product [Ectocarpus sp. CCAP 1310/34]
MSHADTLYLTTDEMGLTVEQWLPVAPVVLWYPRHPLVAEVVSSNPHGVKNLRNLR